jgi:hypothetical protein
MRLSAIGYSPVLSFLRWFSIRPEPERGVWRALRPWLSNSIASAKIGLGAARGIALSQTGQGCSEYFLGL